MDQENYQFLTDNVFRNLGFREEAIHNALRAKMETGQEQISFAVKNQNKSEFEFKLDLKDDGRYYLNVVRASIPKEDGQTISQDFRLFFQRGYNEIEMENMLKGRAVHTTVKKDGDLISFWTKLDLSKTNSSGNHPERREYDNKSSFNLAKELSRLFPGANLTQEDKESMIRNLKQGNQVSSRILIKGVREQVLIEADPHDGKMKVFNSKGEPMLVKEEKARMEVVEDKKQKALPDVTKEMMNMGEGGKNKSKSQGVKV
jgi:hypothetical protein